MAKIARGSEQAMIRLPDGMRDQLKEAAERNGRSMNAEIVARLEEYPALASLQERLAISIHERQELSSFVADLEERLREAEAERAQANYKLRETQNEIVALKEQVKEIEKLRLDLAYQEGMSAALRRGGQIYVKHLARAAKGESISLEAVMAELNGDAAPDEEK